MAFNCFYRLHGLEALIRGELSSSLIHPKAMKPALQEAAAKASEVYKGHFVTHNNIREIYTLKPTYIVDPKGCGTVAIEECVWP